MNLSKLIKDLHRKRIVSEKPNVIIPFILSIIALVIGIALFNSPLGLTRNICYAMFFLSGFSFIFAIIHLIVVKELKK